MAGSKEIREKIAGIKNTQKITKAMQMIAAGKMKKTQERLEKNRAYTRAVSRIIHHLTHAETPSSHPYLEEKPDGRRAILMITSDRGLCGGLNSNLYRLVFKQSKVWEKEGGETHWGILGAKGSALFLGMKVPVIAQNKKIGENPDFSPALGVYLALKELYDQGKVDSLWVASNHFAGALVQKPKLLRLLPVSHQALESWGSGGADQDVHKQTWDYIYEPSSAQVLDQLLRRYLEAAVFHALLGNVASEQAARMVAMQSASDNAGTLTKELQLIYNKARQAAITQELAEIVAGAAAV